MLARNIYVCTLEKFLCGCVCKKVGKGEGEFEKKKRAINGIIFLDKFTIDEPIDLEGNYFNG